MEESVVIIPSLRVAVLLGVSSFFLEQVTEYAALFLPERWHSWRPRLKHGFALVVALIICVVFRVGFFHIFGYADTFWQLLIDQVLTSIALANGAGVLHIVRHVNDLRRQLLAIEVETKRSRAEDGHYPSRIGDTLVVEKTGGGV